MPSGLKSSSRKFLFSVSIHDCRVDTFTCGGKGGSGKDTSNTGVRVVHEPSGAVGECREERSQPTNKRRAFIRMTETPAFKAWHRITTARLLGQPSIDELVAEAMQPQHLKIEERNERGQWIVSVTN
jgi:hypothetical protein